MLDDARGLGALVEAVAARHRDRLPDRRHAGRRRRDRHASSPTPPKSRLSKHPEEFGNGAIEGVAGPEAANNASAAGTLVPLLTLGLPTTATAAIMLAGFQQYGLQPGPLLFATNPQLVWGLIASLLVANFMLLVLNLPLIGLWVRLLTIPKPWLYAGILLFATLGTIGANPSVFELGMLLGLRLLLGYWVMLRRFHYPDRAGRRRPDPRADGGAAAPARAGDQPGRPDRAGQLADQCDPACSWRCPRCFCRCICAGAARQGAGEMAGDSD